MAEPVKVAGGKRRGYRVNWIALIGIACFVYIFLAISLPGLLNVKRSPGESRAKVILQAYGETQRTYKQVNPTGAYASWDDLVKYEWVEEGYSRSNLIEGYSVWTSTEEDKFIIVAFPRKTSPPGYLATFAIREDQILRVYRSDTPYVKEWGEDGDFSAKTWEPIR